MSNTDRKAMTFRLSRLSRERLAELAAENDISATRVVEDLILDRRWFKGQIPDERAGLDEKSRVMKRQAESVKMAPKPLGSIPGKPLTREEREAKMQAFQLPKGKK